MRSMGDLSWLNRYIGKPYKYGGRDMEGMDCYGLLVLIFRERYSTNLPDWVVDEIDLKGRSGQIADVVCSGKWTEMEEAADGDVAVCYRTKLAFHVGLFYGGGVIHCSHGLGVIYQPRHQFENDYVKVVYGEWQP
jgi:cell wall-associated NlpC family hydrolase